MSHPFPPPNFIPTDSAIDGIEVYMPAPEEEEHRPVVEFNCPRCHAVTAYSAADGGLTCTHCGYYEPPQQEIVGKRAQEFEFTLETMARAGQAHGWGEARPELQCQSCGAYTSVPGGSLSHTCPFCGSNRVLQREAPQDLLRPRFLIPFKIEAAACRRISQEWLGSSWLTPRTLRRIARMADFTGIYLPFWTFDAVTQANWQAEVGHRKTERYYSGGKWKTRTRIIWKWESGRVQLGYDDLLIAGTTGVSRLLLGRLDNFNLDDLAPYEPKYLAGLQAQAYDLPLDAAWERARHQMREKTRQACREQASTNRIRNFSMSLEFGQESWRYILLPFYLASYSYNRKSYQVMINAQSGTIAGQRPVDWLKLWLVVAALLAPGITLGAVGAILTMVDEGWFFLILLGFVLGVIGLVIAFGLVKNALGMDDI